MTDQNKWRDWEPVDEELDDMLKPGFSSRFQPHHPLVKLKKNLLINMVWGVLITISYLVVMVFYPIWPVVIALLVNISFNAVAMLGAIRLFRSINTTISGSGSLLQELQEHYHDIRAWGQLQLKLALWVYPFAVAGGYILGATIRSGRSLEELLQKPIFIWVLLLAVVVLVPASYFLAKWMFKKSFGRHLDALKQTIESIQAGY